MTEAIEPSANSMLILEAANPYDLTADDLEILATRIVDTIPGLQVKIADTELHGAGGPWYQVLHLWIGVTFAEAVGYGVVVELCKDWLRDQFRSIRGRKRPKSLVVHELETGKEVLSIRLDSEAEDFVVEVKELPARRKPPGRHRK